METPRWSCVPVPIRQRKSPGAALRGLLGASGLFLLFGCAQFGETEVVEDADVVLPPSAIVVPRYKVIPAAEALSEHCRGGFVLQNEGDEMLPRYVPGTAFVAEQTDFRALRPGMVVVLLKDQQRVARQLVKKTSDGWITRPMHSKIEDPVRMTKAAYIGTVTLAFSPEQS